MISNVAYNIFHFKIRHVSYSKFSKLTAWWWSRGGCNWRKNGSACLQSKDDRGISRLKQVSLTSVQLHNILHILIRIKPQWFRHITRRTCQQ